MILPPQLHKILASFRPRSLLGIALLTGIFTASLTFSIYGLYTRLLIEIPAYGGSITESVVGIPRFINPVLAESQVDRDLTSLVYSGLTKKDADGSFVSDLASNYTVSEDGLVYTFTLSDNAIFHDGSAVTAADVVYTISLIQDTTLKSPRSVEWEGVQAAEVSANTVQFTLKREYPDFLSITNVGILPKKVWGELTPETFVLSDYNQKSIGSGPFFIKTVDKIKGIPSSYTLSAFTNYITGRPYIETMNIVFQKNDTESVTYFKDNKLNTLALLDPAKASAFRGSERTTSVSKLLPRVYALYFNQSKNQNLVDQKVREAIHSAIDKKRIITEGVYGYAIPACSPIPQSLFESTCEDIYAPNVSADLLVAAGYTKNTLGYVEKNGSELALTITSVRNASEIERAAEIIRQNLEAVGIRTTIKLLDIADINQKVIRERDYEVLLYGAQVKKSADLYAYLHSSQRVSPGLNLSLYANTTVDSQLEKLRKRMTDDEKSLAYNSLLAETKKDIPTVFLFSPTFAYLYDTRIKVEDSGDITDISDRFSQISNWYTDTEYVWSGFQNIQLFKKIRNAVY